MYLGRRAICVAIVLGGITAGCSHGAKSTNSTARVGPSTTVANGTVYAGPGNFTVGVTTLQLSTGNAVEVWYPAGGGVDDRPAPGSRSPATTRLPAKPSLFVAAAVDRVVSAAATRAVYRAAPAPSYEWVLDGAGHNAFDDLCVVVPQGGLVALAEKAGIGARFGATLRTAVSDGCSPPDVAVIKTWPVIDEVVTAFLRGVIGPDRTPVGVGPPGTRTIGGVKVTVSARLG